LKIQPGHDSIAAECSCCPHQRIKNGKPHTYWSLVETVRTPDGPRQRTLCYLGELNDSAPAIPHPGWWNQVKL
jgi:hypothetical protein